MFHMEPWILFKIPLKKGKTLEIVGNEYFVLIFFLNSCYNPNSSMQNLWNLYPREALCIFFPIKPFHILVFVFSIDLFDRHLCVFQPNNPWIVKVNRWCCCIIFFGLPPFVHAQLVNWAINVLSLAEFFICILIIF